MKKISTLILSSTFIFTFLLSSCSNESKHVITSEDTKEYFAKAIASYDKFVTNRKREFVNFEPSELNEKATFAIYDSALDQYLINKSFDSFKVDLPLEVDTSFTYALTFDFHSFYAIGASGSPFTIFASKEFKSSFDEFLLNADFNKKVTDEYPIGLDIHTKERTYSLYSNGYMAINYSNGLYLSSSPFDLYIVYLEVMSLMSNLPESIQAERSILSLGTDDDNDQKLDPFTLEYNSKTIQLEGTLKNYFKDDERKEYCSMKFASGIFDYSKMIKVSFGNEHVFYINELGQVIRERNNLNTLGVYAYYLAFETSEHKYDIYHSTLDVDELFDLFK